MNRRFAWLITPLLLACVQLAEAQQPVTFPRIGTLNAPLHSAITQRYVAFRQGLRDLGYVEGRNIAIEDRFAEGKRELLPELATKLVRLKVDIIVTTSTPAALAAKSATATIPIVMASSGIQWGPDSLAA